MQNAQSLTGQFVILEVLDGSHRNVLSGLFDTHGFWDNPLHPFTEDNFPAWFQKATQSDNEGGQLSFAVRELINKQIVGTTRFYKIAERDKRLAIGYTWYVPNLRGTQVNPECKLLLLKHAFETLQMNRVEFFINTLNVQSRAAVAKLGALEEGILRMNRILQNGHPRDTVVYSIIKPEWPQVKAKLETRFSV